MKYFTFFIFSLTQFIYCQNIPIDSFKLNSYKKINTNFWRNYDLKNHEKANYYANLYILKAKDSVTNFKKLCKGYKLKTLIGDENQELIYNKKIVSLSKKLKPSNKNIGKALFNLGRLYLNKKKFDSANTYFIRSLNFAKINNDLYLECISKNNIGIIYSDWLNDKEKALKLFKESLIYYDNKNVTKEYLKKDNLFLLYSIGETFRGLNQHDSAYYYNKLGIEKSINFKLNDFKNIFIYSEGINEYLIGNYSASKDSLLKSYTYINENLIDGNNVIINLFLGKIFYKKGEIIKAKMYFDKMKYLFKKKMFYTKEMKNGLKFLYKLNKANNNYKEELKYINLLLKIDSIYIKQYKNILQENAIINTTLIKKEKKILENELYEKMLNIKLKKILIYALCSIILISLFSFYYYNKKQKIKFASFQKKNFNKIERKDEVSYYNISIPKKTIKIVLDNLSDFEKNENYLKQNITSFELAKDFKTNKKYLSNIIKEYKGKSIPKYINDLRINYTIERLKNDKKFSKFSISAIAEEVGFSNNVSFTQAFKKVTDLNPAFYIKELKKMKDS